VNYQKKTVIRRTVCYETKASSVTRGRKFPHYEQGHGLERTREIRITKGSLTPTWKDTQESLQEEGGERNRVGEKKNAADDNFKATPWRRISENP